MAKSATTRTRNFATVVYPESAPEDWKVILGESCIPCFISPLHDQDVNPGGEPKKEHYHVMLMFDSVKTPAQAEEVFQSIGGVGCEIVQSIRGYARYLCHLDNPEKHQYSPDDVVAYGGADFHGVIGLAIDKYKAIGEMTAFIREQCITSYAELFDWTYIHRPDWNRVLCDNGTYVIKEYLKSINWEIRHPEEEDDD